MHFPSKHNPGRAWPEVWETGVRPGRSIQAQLGEGHLIGCPGAEAEPVCDLCVLTLQSLKFWPPQTLGPTKSRSNSKVPWPRTLILVQLVGMNDLKVFSWAFLRSSGVEIPKRGYRHASQQGVIHSLKMYWVPTARQAAWLREHTGPMFARQPSVRHRQKEFSEALCSSLQPKGEAGRTVDQGSEKSPLLTLFRPPQGLALPPLCVWLTPDILQNSASRRPSLPSRIRNASPCSPFVAPE